MDCPTYWKDDPFFGEGPDGAGGKRDAMVDEAMEKQRDAALGVPLWKAAGLTKDPGADLDVSVSVSDSVLPLKDAIGDIHSDARGSGARFNGGKAKVEYIPMRVLLDQRGARYEVKHSLLLDEMALAVAGFEEGHDEQAAAGLELLFSNSTLEECCAVFDFGAKKYKAWNWAKGMPWSVPLACIKRHWLKLAAGEENDPESGHSHLGHIACNLVMLVHYVRHYPEGDDRPPPSIFNRGEEG